MPTPIVNQTHVPELITMLGVIASGQMVVSKDAPTPRDGSSVTQPAPGHPYRPQAFPPVGKNPPPWH